LAKSRPDLVKRAEEAFRREHAANRDFPLPGEPGWAEKAKREAARKQEVREARGK
jgi:hypothetical protein